MDNGRKTASPDVNSGKYIGSYKDGKPDGMGTFVFDNGDRYEGHFKDGRFDGEGIYTWNDGDTYVGTFENGKENGVGIAYFAKSGNVYEGEFKDGAREGKGKFTWSNGAEYEGEFVANSRTGLGKLTTSTGDIYVGEFLNGAYNGKGTLYKVDGRVYSGIWDNNRMADVHLASAEEAANGVRVASEVRQAHDNSQSGSTVGTVGSIHVEMADDGRYNIVATVNGKSVSHTITQQQYDKLLAVDDLQRARMFARMFPDIDSKAIMEHGREFGAALLVELVAASGKGEKDLQEQAEATVQETPGRMDANALLQQNFNERLDIADSQKQGVSAGISM